LQHGSAMNLKTLFIAAILSAPVVATADTPKSDSKDMKDTKDVKTTKLDPGDMRVLAHFHHVNQAEIDMAKLAKSNGGSAVKAYGDTLRTDHEMIDKDLQAYAKSHKVTIGKDEPTPDDKAMDDRMAALKKVKGTEFDRMFLAISIDAHDVEITRAKAAVDTVQDPELKTLVMGIQPVLQRHADKARELQAAIPKS
jgi:predicted outer membrane protein